LEIAGEARVGRANVFGGWHFDPKVVDGGGLACSFE
jgi:hypothetical protein